VPGSCDGIYNGTTSANCTVMQNKLERCEDFGIANDGNENNIIGNTAIKCGSYPGSGDIYYGAGIGGSSGHDKNNNIKFGLNNKYDNNKAIECSRNFVFYNQSDEDGYEMTGLVVTNNTSVRSLSHGISIYSQFNGMTSSVDPVVTNNLIIDPRLRGVDYNNVDGIKSENEIIGIETIIPIGALLYKTKYTRMADYCSNVDIGLSVDDTNNNNNFDQMTFKNTRVDLYIPGIGGFSLPTIFLNKPDNDNPLVSGKVYQNKWGTTLTIYQTVIMNPTNDEEASVSVCLDKINNPKEFYRDTVSAGNPQGKREIKIIRVPPNWYFSFITKNATLENISQMLGN